MIVYLPQVLNADEVKAIHNLLADQKFVDGGLSAGVAAAKVKRNLELDLGSERHRSLSDAISAALRRNVAFVDCAFPKRYGVFVINRYETGMVYGDHVDNPLNGLYEGDPIRSDLSITIFLSDPKTYNGGELVIDSDNFPKAIKLPAGDAVVYPASTMHRVEPVTQGVRLAAVGWIQSLVPDPARRQLLCDLSSVKAWVRQPEMDSPDMRAETQRRIDKSFVNLLRMWSDA